MSEDELGTLAHTTRMSLFREILDESFRCKMKRERYIQTSQGPLSEKQLLIASPFYACQIDLFGPLMSFLPRFEMKTRAVKAKESKIRVFIAGCIVTSNVNLQVCEIQDTCSSWKPSSGYPANAVIRSMFVVIKNLLAYHSCVKSRLF